MIFSSIAWGIKKPFQLVDASLISEPMGFIERNLRRIELIGLFGLAVGLAVNPALFMGGIAAAWQGIAASVGHGWSIIPAAFNACANVIAIGYNGLAAGASALWANVLAPAFNGASVGGAVLEKVMLESGGSITATTVSNAVASTATPSSVTNAAMQVLGAAPPMDLQTQIAYNFHQHKGWSR
jgi:hypothetical protein